MEIIAPSSLPEDHGSSNQGNRGIFLEWIGVRIASRFGAFFLLLVGLYFLSATRLQAQIFISYPDNYDTGTNYFSDDTEFGGFLGVDLDFTSVGNLSIQGDFNTNDISANSFNLVSNSYSADETPSANALDLWSGFSPGITSASGVANSWLHANLDFGDLTYTGTDTPAFNNSQLSSGGQLYPTIYSTGYDGNTTWVWRENGLAAQADTGSLGMQMTLDGGSNLTINRPSDSKSLILDPESGGFATSASSVSLEGMDWSSDQFSIITGNNAIVFTTGNTTTSVTASSVASLYSSGALPTVIGSSITAVGLQSFALGNGLGVEYYDSIVMGANNVVPWDVSSTAQTTWQAEDPLFVIGDGQSADALDVLKNGDTTMGGNTVINGNVTVNGPTTVFGHNTTFVGNVSLAAPQGNISNAQ